MDQAILNLTSHVREIISLFSKSWKQTATRVRELYVNIFDLFAPVAQAVTPLV